MHQFATVENLKTLGIRHPATTAEDYYNSVLDNLNDGVGKLVDRGMEPYLVDRGAAEFGMEPYVAIYDAMIDRPQTGHVELDLHNGPVVVPDRTAVVWK